MKGLAADLVVTLLAVNQWTLERAFAIYDGLQREGLFDLTAVARMQQREVGDRLERARFARGDYMIGLLAGRILSVACALAGDGERRLCELEQSREIEKLDTILLGIKGIGSTVLANFKLLRGIKS